MIESTPAITIHEIASFAPVSPTLRMEPSGWAVVGLPANFIAGAGNHVRSGVLLGQSAEVRFAPTRFVFDFSDGDALSSASGGATWAAAGLREFSETPTSHTYGVPGKFVATVSVEYAAEYRIGGGEWTAVPGFLSIPTDSPITVTVRSARTVLVDRLCTHPRPGPGC
ncbi:MULTISPECIES: PKD domain-containing protein [unclassified Plantibacter]|uniref:PKD domain-containing protein n=1 Tax=unclassified Plantibacter TaxID=2624265 RepID=UPI003D331278